MLSRAQLRRRKQEYTVVATTLPLDSSPRAARADQVLHIFVAVKKARNLPLELCRMERLAE